jgi:hypothetical protein
LEKHVNPLDGPCELSACSLSCCQEKRAVPLIDFPALRCPTYSHCNRVGPGRPMMLPITALVPLIVLSAATEGDHGAPWRFAPLPACRRPLNALHKVRPRRLILKAEACAAYVKKICLTVFTGAVAGFHSESASRLLRWLPYQNLRETSATPRSGAF